MAENSEISVSTLLQGTPEEDLAQLVDSVKAGNGNARQLVALLPENHPVYAGKSSNQVIRMRGYLLAAFEVTGTPPSATIFLLDELQNSRSPYMVAAAAKAIRGLESRRSEILPFLFKAIENIKWTDDALSFETYKPDWPLAASTSALAEIFKSFGWFGAFAKTLLPELQNLQVQHERIFSEAVKTELTKALQQIAKDKNAVPESCCEPVFRRGDFFPQTANSNEADLNQVVFEDQDGEKVPFQTFFREKPTVLIFFYTRCDNPNKCSLSVTRLGHLQQLLSDARLENIVRTAAITYDTGFDLPFRLKAYAEKRGVLTDAENRVFRVESGFAELAHFLNLGVNFMGPVVTNHQIELYVLDKGKVAGSFQRLQWEPEEVLTFLQSLAYSDAANATETVSVKPEKVESGNGATGNLNLKQPVFSVIWPVLVAFFPKCPMCWASYLSLFGIASLEAIPYSPWLLPVFTMLMLSNLYFSYRSIKRRNGTEPFYLSCLGALFILLALMLQLKFFSLAGLFFFLSGSVLNALPFYTYLKVKNLVLKPLSRA